MSEFEHEPIRGLPAHLPAGERILWQGTPSWRRLALDAFHIRKVAIYFALMLAWRILSLWGDGAPAGEIAVAVLWLLPLVLAGLGLLALLAYLVGRTTVYTITSRRLVMRIGIALPMTLNIPFRLIGGASLKANADGTGDIPVAIAGRDRVAYLILWPHARPWRVARPEPMLRGVPDATRVADILAGALTAVSAASANARPIPAPSLPAERAAPAARPLTAAVA